MIQIDLMPDHSEIIHYEQNEIPLYIHTWNLSVYPGMSAPCHWHEDLEWSHILEGKMCYYVNGRRMVLQEKESLFINARQMHYSEKVTLNDLAAFAHISRSKCCRIFKHYLQQSPIDFLNAYRLKVSCSLLASTNKTITEIAFACGFNHLSYYSKYFAESYGCTPREYRKRNTACRNT